jgi:hypothetical protein
MDRELVQEHLHLAERHVAQGAELVERQRRLIEKLESDGHDTTAARTILRTLEDTQAIHVADCERLSEQLNGAR